MIHLFPLRARPWRRKGCLKLRKPCAFQLECPLACPTWIVADRFSLNGSGEISGISLIPESEMHLWTTGIPHQRRCIVADRFLLIHKAFEQGLRRCQFIPADKFV